MGLIAAFIKLGKRLRTDGRNVHVSDNKLGLFLAWRFTRRRIVGSITPALVAILIPRAANKLRKRMPTTSSSSNSPAPQHLCGKNDGCKAKVGSRAPDALFNLPCPFARWRANLTRLAVVQTSRHKYRRTFNFSVSQIVQSAVRIKQRIRLNPRTNWYERSDRQKLFTIRTCQIGHGTHDTLTPE